jgi:hypothetical protein
MPLALVSPFGFSLCPGSAECLLLGRRVTALQDSAQDQSDRSLTQGGSQGCLVAKLLDHLIRPLQERGRDRQAEGLGGLQVDDQLELGRLLDGQVAGLGSFQDLVDAGPRPRRTRRTSTPPAAGAWPPGPRGALADCRTPAFP